MASVPIVGFKFGWNPKTKQGAVQIKLANGQEYPVPIGNAAELAAVATVLNESPIVLNMDTGYIMTPDWEPVGDD
jgi:hypothetical protein